MGYLFFKLVFKLKGPLIKVALFILKRIKDDGNHL